MAGKSERILLFTQDPRMRDETTSALEALQIVEVREATALRRLLDRGADLVIVDLNLPNRALAAAAALLSDRRELPALILATGSAAQWISRGNPGGGSFRRLSHPKTCADASGDCLKTAASCTIASSAVRRGSASCGIASC